MQEPPWSFFDASESRLILKAEGQNVQDLLKLEPGIHRIQRVPPTEANGRRHTSTIAVAVLPYSTFSPEYDEKDFKVEVSIGTGPGGQHRNKTMTAVKITHIPSGLNASADGRSQHINRQDAKAVLLIRLIERDFISKNASSNAVRVGQIGDMGRGTKIRTYNFIENRTKDERIQKKFRTSDMMDGKLDLIYSEEGRQDQSCPM